MLGSIFKAGFVNPNKLGRRIEATCSGGCSVGFGAWETQFYSCF